MQKITPKPHLITDEDGRTGVDRPPNLLGSRSTSSGSRGNTPYSGPKQPQSGSKPDEVLESLRAWLL